MRDDDALLRGWRQRCSVLFVDEAQDLDRAQLDLAVFLAADVRDIFLVGGDDQTKPSIHGGSAYSSAGRSSMVLAMDSQSSAGGVPVVLHRSHA